MATDFGRDLWCRTTLVTTRYASGIDLMVNALVRRITTPRGRLKYHRAYGFDVSQFTGLEITPSSVFGIQSELESEIESDPRVYDGSVTVTIAEIQHPNRTDLEISAFGDSELGPFDFVTTIDKVTLELLNIRRAA